MEEVGAEGNINGPILPRAEIPAYFAEGNINAPVRPGPTGMREYLEVIQDSLISFFKVGYQKYYEAGGSDANIIRFVNKTLKDNNAIIAGGFLLKTIHRYEHPGHLFYNGVDIDIYVPCKNLSRFNKTMIKLTDTTILKQHNATTYCRSFLRMNGIRSVQEFYKLYGVDAPKSHRMDIMAVRNSRSPLEVVQNFDLTFCQIWYDGESVWATHPEHVRNKVGFLQNDYIPLLIRGNRFLQRRLRKYIHRGFNITPETTKITITPDMIKGYFIGGESKVKCNPIERNEAYYKKWYSRALFRFIIYNKYKVFQKLERDRQDILINMNSIREIYINISQDQLNKPDADMDSLEPTDGYDSDDFDIDHKETYYPIVNKFSPAIIEDKRAAWLAQDDETKLWKCIRRLIGHFYFIKPAMSPFGFSLFYNRGIQLPTRQKVDRVYKMMEDLDMVIPDAPLIFSNYANTLKEKSARVGTCAITMDDTNIYDLHNHTLDQAVGIDGLKQYLNTLIGQGDKNNLPCYIVGCTWILSLDEIRAIVNRNYYVTFTIPILAPLPPPDALLGTQGLGDNSGEAETKIDLIEIIRNAPSDAGGWRNIYHHVMCPFCLSYISRDSGCTYVKHPNIEGLPGALAPFCKPQNIIKDIRDKYEAAAGGGKLEVCAECGRPCVHHEHFDLADPPGLAPHHLTAAGNPDYARCAGGGRAEQMARIIAVRDTVAGAEGMDPKDLRVAAGLAAEVAASDPALLARGAEIVAKAAATRSEANLNDGDGLGNNPLGAIVVDGGKRRIGKVCSHGYQTYKEKIRKTRRGRGKKSKGTRKN